MAEHVKERIVAYLPRLRRFAFALTGCPDRGEDLLQETCAKAIANAGQWQAGTRLDSWLFRIAQNHWIDTLRASRAAHEGVPIEDMPLPDQDSAGNSAFAQHHHRAIRSAVSALPPDQRAVVALVCIEGFAYREAAEILDLPIGTVMSRLARARKSLHQRLYGDEDAAEDARDSKA